MNLFLNAPVLVALLLSVAIYWGWFQTEQARIRFLALVSLGIFASLHPVFVLFCFGLLAYCTWSSRTIIQGKRSHVLLYIMPAIVVVLLGAKYGGEIYRELFAPSSWTERNLLVPLGISYFIFRLIQVLFDCRRGLIKHVGFWELACFVLFPPTLPAGPIETYQNFFAKKAHGFDKDLFFAGLNRILSGYTKKIIIVSYVFDIFLMPRLKVRTFPYPDTIISAQVNFYLAAQFLRAYLDLSAYSDLAIGYSALFGFRIVENFDRPFLSTSLASFWRRWHVSLSSWCRNNIYFPVFGWSRSVSFALYTSMLVMGLWHHFNLNWLAWGLYHGFGLHVQMTWNRWKKQNTGLGVWAQKKPAQVIGWLMTILFITLGYSFVSSSDLPQALRLFNAGIEGLVTYPLIVARYLS